jgi:hypothetical protein
MNWRSSIRILLSLSLSLGIMSVGGLSEDQESKRSRTKRVFTNDDLQQYQEKLPSDLAADPRSAEMDKVSNKGKANFALESLGEKTKVRSYWAERLREAENGLSQRRNEEQRFIGSLAEFQKTFAEAKTEFQKKTAQWQIEDTEKNLTRATAERKKAEEERANVVAEAVNKGFKAEDLKRQETAVSKQTQ